MLLSCFLTSAMSFSALPCLPRSEPCEAHLVHFRVTLSLAHLQVSHYLVLSQLDESLWADIRNNIQSLQPMIEQERRRQVAAAKQHKETSGKERVNWSQWGRADHTH